MPKVSFAAALPVGTESLNETVDIELYDPSPISLVKDEINQRLPFGVKVTHLEDITHENKRPKLKESHFYITMNGLDVKQADIEKFLDSDYFPITKIGKRGEQIINARSIVKSMNLIPPRGLKLVITHIPGPELKPIDIIKGLFHLNDDHVQSLKILKTRQITN